MLYPIYNIEFVLFVTKLLCDNVAYGSDWYLMATPVYYLGITDKTSKMVLK